MICNSTASLEKEFKATCNADLDDMISEATKSLPKKAGKAYKMALFQNEWVKQNLFTFEKFNFPVKK